MVQIQNFLLPLCRIFIFLSLEIYCSEADDGSSHLRGFDPKTIIEKRNKIIDRPCWTILWLKNPLWEEYYIRDLLFELPLCARNNLNEYDTNFIFHKGMDLSAEYFRNTILVTSTRPIHKKDKQNERNRQVMNALDKHSYQYVTFVIGEETEPNSAVCTADGTDFRQIMDRSALVIRNYWAKDCEGFNKVITAPLLVTASAQDNGDYTAQCGSLRESVLQFGKPPTERNSLLYFASSHTMAHRTSFVESVLEVAPEDTKSLSSENKIVLNYRDLGVHININKRAKYGAVMADAKFAAILAGNVEETWRFTEALFCGAIPFLQKAVYDYYQPWLPNDLIKLLPVFDIDEEFKSQFHELLDEAINPNDFTRHSLAVQSAAQAWLNDTRSYLLQSLDQVANLSLVSS